MSRRTPMGMRFREFLTEELRDREVRLHYGRAKASAAQAICDARRRSGLTQVELGRRIGSDQKGVWRLESGNQNATLETLNRIARATGGVLEIHIRAPKSRKVKV